MVRKMSIIDQKMQKLAQRGHQEGVVLAIFAIGMLMVLVMGGLALDVSHMLLNKSRLQNTVDAAALVGAKVLDQGGDVTQAEDAAVTLFGDNSSAGGNGEIAANISTGDVVVEFSATLEPFATGSTPAEYVRVRVETLTLDAWLLQLIGVTEKIVRASAVAGPTPTIGSVCDISPFIVCGDPSAEPPLFGFEKGSVDVLKGSSENGSVSGPIGPGNFFTARLGDSSGGNDLKLNIAGAYEGCAVPGEMMPLEPGNSKGPVEFGVNNRMGINKGGNNIPPEFKPDVITESQATPLVSDDMRRVFLDDKLIADPHYDEESPTADHPDPGAGPDGLDFNYDDYNDRIDAKDYDYAPPEGEFGRRNLTVTIADCSSKASGATEIPIMGFGCYFLLEYATGGGGEDEIFGQFLDACEASGRVGPVPSDLPGPHKVVLYKDADSKDS